MRVLVDSDVFCELGIGNLLADTISALDATLQDCGRLPALPYMLRRGKLPKRYGAESCAVLIELAQSIAPIGAPNPQWLDKLTSIQDIDPGEAQLFAVAAGDSLAVITGDKRALMALKDVEGYPEALAGRIVVLEAAILALGERLGYAEVKRRLGFLTTSHQTLKICFSPETANPRAALESYYRDFAAEVHPLMLWNPYGGKT
jgi:hypothetical protein